MHLIKKDSLINELQQSAVKYASPVGLTYFWNFGSLVLVSLIVQVITGVFLAMFYSNSIYSAFDSVEHIMRDVPFGWLLRYIHANGALVFFLVVYFFVFKILIIL